MKLKFVAKPTEITKAKYWCEKETDDPNSPKLIILEHSVKIYNKKENDLRQSKHAKGEDHAGVYRCVRDGVGVNSGLCAEVLDL
jgi:hypothetical protein